MIRLPLATLAAGLLATAASAQTIVAPFDTAYSFTNLGSVTGIPGPLGGITFLHSDPNTLLLGGAANSGSGAIYAVPVTRDGSGHITGFGTPVLHASAPNIDGGLTYGPGNVLFATGFPVHTLMQFRVGSTAPDSTIALGTATGIASSVGTCQFVPAGFPGAGSFKIASYSASTWHDVTLAPNASGTFDITGAGPAIGLSGGPEGILYPPGGSPLLPDFTTVLVSEYQSGNIAVYDLDANGDPVPATRRDFMTGLTGAEGAVIDPVSGDMLFSTFGGGDRVIAVRGFATCGVFTAYGNGCQWLNGLARLTGTGCPLPGNTITIDVSGGLPNGIGQLGYGSQPANIPLGPCTLLLMVEAALPVTIDNFGGFRYQTTIPNLAVFHGFDTYWQVGFYDSGVPFGIAASNAVHMFIL